MNYATQPGKGVETAVDYLPHAMAQTMGTPSDLRDEARQLARLLGSTAQRAVSPGVWRYLGPALAWPGWLLEGTGLNGGSAFPDTITVAQDLLLVANLLSNLDHDQVFALILAQPMSTLGPFAQLAATSAPCLHDAVTVMLLFINSQNPIFNVQQHEPNDQLVLEVLPQIPLGLLGTFLVMGMLVALYQFMLAGGCAPGRLQIETTLEPAQNPPWSGLNCEVAGSRTCDRLVLPQSLARQPNPRSDADLWAVVQARARRLMAATAQSALESRIREQIRAGVRRGSGVPRLKHLAMTTGVSERTLLRTMQRQNLSYHAIANDERRSAALSMIQNPGTALVEIATTLGFSSQSSFGRTFKTWTGVSPGEYRRREGIGPERTAG